LCSELLKKTTLEKKKGFWDRPGPLHIQHQQDMPITRLISIYIYVPAAALTKEKLLPRGEMGLENRSPGNRTRQIYVTGELSFLYSTCIVCKLGFVYCSLQASSLYGRLYTACYLRAEALLII
jgi:hypothetical protein